MFIAYLWMIASAARCVIARGLGGIYILLIKFLRKENKILEFGCIFWFEMFISYFKILLVSLPALTMDLGGIYVSWIKFWENDAIYGEFGCIHWHNYGFKISHFLYKHNDIVSVEGGSIVLYIECIGGICSFEKFFKKLHNLMSFSVYSDIILS